MACIQCLFSGIDGVVGGAVLLTEEERVIHIQSATVHF